MWVTRDAGEVMTREEFVAKAEACRLVLLEMFETLRTDRQPASMPKEVSDRTTRAFDALQWLCAEAKRWPK